MHLPRWIWLVLGIAPVAGLFGLLVWGTARDAGNPGALSVYDSSGEARVVNPVPPLISISLLDGDAAPLAQFIDGKVAMIDFWASWCPPCRQEAPEIERAWRSFRDRGVVFIGVDVWDDRSNARDFVREFGLTYPIAFDPKGQVGVGFGVTGLPEKYFIDRNGEIVRKLIGPMTADRLSTELNRLLQQSEPNSP